MSTSISAACVVASPIGRIAIHADRGVLARIEIGVAEALHAPDDALLAEAAAQMAAYFADPATRFDLPLTPSPTPRGAVLREGIAAVPAGALLSYGALADRLQSSARAIGQACARNPFPLVIPCHRIVGVGGALGHYSAGTGVPTKRWLLNHEGDRTWAN